ncbi:MAG TPA: dihydrofolate reductase, partial [Clostridia bacterium]|nr:dihydrofolate reductase [Clostridia bacterium]
MKAIVNVDINWGIGYQGKLLMRIPEDMKFVRQTTLGKVIVMGRETFESLPGKKPLEGRVNIVLSKSADYEDTDITV